jgi:hypothetical protein
MSDKKLSLFDSIMAVKEINSRYEQGFISLVERDWQIIDVTTKVDYHDSGLPDDDEFPSQENVDLYYKVKSQIDYSGFVQKYEQMKHDFLVKMLENLS